MEERLALEVNSLVELEEQLRSYLEDLQGKGHWYRGQARQHKEMVTLLSDDDTLQEAIDRWLQQSKYEKLLKLWVNGGTVDWKRLYMVGEGSESSSIAAPAQPRRISLPTYPFARERYWISIPPVETLRGCCPLPLSSSTVAITSASPIENVQPQSAEASPLSIAQHVSLREVGGRNLAPPIKTNEWGKASTIGTGEVVPHASGASHIDYGADSAITKRVALEKELVRSLAEVLDMEEGLINMEKPFIEIGLDSIIGVEWIQSLNKQYVLKLKASAIYDYLTIRQLAGFLAKELLQHQQTTVQPMSTLSLDDLLQQVQKGAINAKEADSRLNQIFPQLSV
jgi:polyketide synthase PksN